MAVRTVKYELLGRRYELAGSGQGDFVTVHVSPLLLLPLPVPASHYTGSAAHDLHSDGELQPLACHPRPTIVCPDLTWASCVAA